MVKKIWRYVYSFWQYMNVTDGQVRSTWQHSPCLCKALRGKNMLNCYWSASSTLPICYMVYLLLWYNHCWFFLSWSKFVWKFGSICWKICAILKIAICSEFYFFLNFIIKCSSYWTYMLHIMCINGLSLCVLCCDLCAY